MATKSNSLRKCGIDTFSITYVHLGILRAHLHPLGVFRRSFRPRSHFPGLLTIDELLSASGFRSGQRLLAIPTSAQRTLVQVPRLQVAYEYEVPLFPPTARIVAHATSWVT